MGNNFVKYSPCIDFYYSKKFVAERLLPASSAVAKSWWLEI